MSASLQASRLRALGIALFGDPARVILERRVLNGLTLLVATTGIVSTVQNLAVGTSYLMVAATVVCTIYGAVGYLLARRLKHVNWLQALLFLFLLALIIFSWITQAGSQGTIGYYFMLVACFAVVIFRGTAKIASLALTGATLVVLLALEYYEPTIILPYPSPFERFADVAFAVPLCLLMVSTIIHLMYREYHRERSAKDNVLQQVTAEKERVERGMREKQRLLTVVSHDIANALTVLQGEISLSRFTARADQTSHPLDLDRMAYACNNIEEIIASVRMMEALEQGKLAFSTKPVDLAAVFEHAEVIFGKRLAQRRMRFDFPELTDEIRFVMAEPRILANQVFGNLLSNAIKFSHPDSCISVSVNRQADQTSIRVTDHGIGIPQTLLVKLFDLDAKTTRTGTDGEPGTGFGLRTVKHFVELFGGRLEDQLTRGDGARGPSRHHRGDSPEKWRGVTASPTRFDRSYLQTNVVTVVAASEAEKPPPLTVTAVPAVRLALDDVTFGVHEAGAVPPEMVIGTVSSRGALVDGHHDHGAVDPVIGREQEIRVGIPRNVHHDVSPAVRTCCSYQACSSAWSSGRALKHQALVVVGAAAQRLSTTTRARPMPRRSRARSESTLRPRRRCRWC